MNLEKFTERSRGFIQAAQTIAMRENHQRLLPEHLLKALMDDSEGLAANLISHGGGDAKAVREHVDASVARIAKVTGDAGQTYMDNVTAKVLDEAETLATKAGDSFVPVERVLTALAIVKSKAKDALDAGKVTPMALNAAINDVRKGRTADSASAEEGYDALNKYARDLTEAAREGKSPAPTAVLPSVQRPPPPPLAATPPRTAVATASTVAATVRRGAPPCTAARTVAATSAAAASRPLTAIPARRACPRGAHGATPLELRA